MSKALTFRTEIPASVAEVFALRTSQRWVDLKAERLRDGSTVTSRTERGDGGVDLVVSRELPAGVPGFLERFLPQDGKVLQNEAWGPPDAAGVCRGTWSVEIPGAPATLGGSSTLEPAPGGSVQSISGAAKVSVPLLGGKAEQLIVDMTTKLMAKEAELMARELST